MDAPPDYAAHDDAGARPPRRGGAARRRDSAAEAELYRRLAPRVRLYGLRHLRDRHARGRPRAAGAAHDARAAARREAARARADRLVRARHVSHGRARSAAHARRARSGCWRPSPATCRCRPVTRAARSITRASPDCLRGAAGARALGARPHLLRRLRASEVASELGISAGNVRVIRHRGLEHLRQCVTGSPTL